MSETQQNDPTIEEEHSPPSIESEDDDPYGSDEQRDNEQSQPLRLTLSLPDEDAGQQVLRCLASRDSDISVTAHGVSTGVGDCQLSVDSVTKKQWEAVTLAVELGYYDQPRESNLQQLSDELGISTSATSQRLGSVERKLVKSLVDSCTLE